MSAVVNIGVMVVVIIAALGGFRRGLRKELLNLVGIIVAVTGGILLAKPVALLFKNWGIMEEVPYLLAFVVGFVATTLGFGILKGRMAPKGIDFSERVSGAILGVLKGAMIAAILVYCLIGLWPRASEELEDAPMVGMVLPLTFVLDTVADLVSPLLPEELHDQIREGYKIFDQTRKGVGEAVETIEEVGETVREVQERAQDAVATVDSLSRAIVPPPR